MNHISDSDLLSPTDLRDLFLKTPEGKVFWGSFNEVFLKNYGSNGEKRILTPIVFRISVDSKIKYAGKFVTLESDNNMEIDIYEGLLEADNLLLLMSVLIKDYLQKMFSGITNEMYFKEIALLLGDKQFVVGERIRQLLIGLCKDLELVLNKNNPHD